MQQLEHSAEQGGDVLLLGASGRLGQVLRRFWCGPGRLICQSRQNLPGFVQSDLLAPTPALSAAAQQARTVICLAGITPDHAARTDDPFSLNTDLALAAIRLGHEAGVARVFLASSAAVYGAAEGVLHENIRCRPVSEYGRSKLEMEHQAQSLARQLGQDTCALRIGNVIGSDAIIGGWHPDMQLDTFPTGDGPRRSYIGPKTFCDVLSAMCAAQELPKVVNVSEPGTVAMSDLLDAARLHWAKRPAQAGALHRVALCTQRLEAYLGAWPQKAHPAQLVAEWRLQHLAPRYAPAQAAV